jgi:hypothetical protein
MISYCKNNKIICCVITALCGWYVDYFIKWCFEGMGVKFGRILSGMCGFPCPNYGFPISMVHKGLKVFCAEVTQHFKI